MNDNFKRVLALSPHIDDIELGAGGSLARWVEEGKEVFSVILTLAVKSIPEGFPKNITEQEAKQATKVIGIALDNLFICKYEARTFPQFRQEILETMIELRETLNPDLVLLPSLKDMHQDHRTVSEEGFRTFKYINILAYEVPWNMISCELTAFVLLQKRHLDKKVEAVKRYQSQSRNKKYNKAEAICGLARVRGAQINSDYAEAFEVVRWVIR